ncbi:MAG: YaiI/YqxD family protein [Paracoccaceae bacterium]
MIYLDADSCPVKAETERVATRHKTRVVMVSNGGIRPSRNPLIEIVVVPSDPDAADIWIADHAQAGDVVVTADMPLAQRCVENGALVLRPNGDLLTTANIGPQLALRNLASDLRAADPFRQSKGQRPFSNADRSRFLNGLEQALRKAVSQTG